MGRARIPYTLLYGIQAESGEWANGILDLTLVSLRLFCSAGNMRDWKSKLWIVVTCPIVHSNFVGSNLFVLKTSVYSTERNGKNDKNIMKNIYVDWRSVFIKHLVTYCSTNSIFHVAIKGFASSISTRVRLNTGFKGTGALVKIPLVYPEC